MWVFVVDCSCFFSTLGLQILLYAPLYCAAHLVHRHFTLCLPHMYKDVNCVACVIHPRLFCLLRFPQAASSMSDQQQQQQNKDLEDPRILEVCVVVPCPAEGLVKSSKLKRISHPHALRRILSQIVDWLRHTLMREDVTFEVRHTCVVEHPLTGVRTPTASR